jgi:hypothetical protein
MATINESIKPAYHNVEWVVDLMQRSLVKPDNSFQRRFVWAEQHQVKLIESILTGFPIPEIYLWLKDVYDDTDDRYYNIIDGQQRLNSILKFFNNDFKLSIQHLDGKNKGAEFSNKRFSDLTPDWKRVFWSYNIHFRLVSPSVSYEEIVKMFLKLNSVNLTLNPQELRNARFSGKFIELSVALANHKIFQKHEIFSINDIRRMKDIEFTSNILAFFRKGISEDTTQDTINRIYDIYNNEYAESRVDKDMFDAIAQEVDAIINNDNTVRIFLKKHTHLYSLFVALYVTVSRNKNITMTQVDQYKNFVTCYHEANTQLVSPNMTPAILEEYKQLSLTGTRKKANRIRRADIIQLVLTS